MTVYNSILHSSQRYVKIELCMLYNSQPIMLQPEQNPCEKSENSPLLSQCLRKIFTKCFYNIPALPIILDFDPEIATFCAVSSRIGVQKYCPIYIMHQNDEHIILRFPSRTLPFAVTEHGIELLTPKSAQRQWRKYSVYDNGKCTQTSYAILKDIDELETEISLTNRLPNDPNI
jgi:hypothetical protein